MIAVAVIAVLNVVPKQEFEKSFEISLFFSEYYIATEKDNFRQPVYVW